MKRKDAEATEENENTESPEEIDLMELPVINSACEAIPKSAFQKLMIAKSEIAAQTNQEGTLGPTNNSMFDSNAMAKSFQILC